MSLEGVLLTGGAGRRMGADKASLLVDGVPLGEKLAAILASVCERVTVLGRSPISGYGFLADEEEFAGPLQALARFRPETDRVVVVSCDLPLLTAEAIRGLVAIEGFQAVVPEVEGRLQPLCAVYGAGAFLVAAELAAVGERRMMAWLDRLDVRRVEPESPHLFRNVNTVEEWRAALDSREG